jgi:GNAT superfamily N-acetyltransferase
VTSGGGILRLRWPGAGRQDAAGPARTRAIIRTGVEDDGPALALVADEDGHVQELNGVAIAPEHQSRGIGHLVLAAAWDEAVRHLRVSRGGELTLGLVGGRVDDLNTHSR